MSFRNKVVIITGGSSGIGLAAANIFAREGANVAIVGRSEAKLKTAAEAIAKVGNKPLTIRADVSKDDEAKTIVKQTVDKFGKLDVLVNNAGVVNFDTLLGGRIMENYDAVMNTNLRSAIHITSLAAPFLVQTKGNVVNVSSVLGVSFLGASFGLIYGISKAGLDHFTRGAALEFASSGVRVNTVSPGPTRTEILANCGIDRTWDETRENLKLDRVSEPEEIADLIVYLASDKARSITGSYYAIDNGSLLKN